MIPVRRAHLRVAAGSDAGRTGKNNEDQFAISAFQLGPANATPVLFAVLADGIGGHRAGEVASHLAVEMISDAVAQSDGSQPGAIMEAAILRANQAILAHAEGDDEKKGMGTTIISAWIIGDKLYTASVGNSRLYLLREDGLQQINWDHTWVQEAVDAGALTPELARSHPNANIIRRYLGSRRPVEVDFRLRVKPGENEKQEIANQGFPLLPGDRLLLCSDGLNDMVEDADIRELAWLPDLVKARQALIDKANDAGGKDNITVVLLEVPGRTKKKQREARSKLLAAAIRALAIVGLVALLLWALGQYALPLLRPDPTAMPTATIAPSATSQPAATPTPQAGLIARPTNTPQSAPVTITSVPFGASAVDTETPSATP
ncbi:MAG: serine/threonine-protein phosphatase [Anaerolineae bacterium]|nr:MAG: serine/threonine-protein phosphatase [Anaerolineae bacterium]